MRPIATPPKSHRAQARRKKTRGQSMVEYSVVSHALLLLGAGATMGISQYLKLFESMDLYLRSVYAVLQMGGV